MENKYLRWVCLLSGSMLAACGHRSYSPIFKASPAVFSALRPDSGTARLTLADSATKPPATSTCEPTHRGASPQGGHARGRRAARAQEYSVQKPVSTASQVQRVSPRPHYRGAAAANDPFAVIAVFYILLLVTGLVFLIRFLVRAATRLARRQKAKP